MEQKKLEVWKCITGNGNEKLEKSNGVGKEKIKKEKYGKRLKKISKAKGI
jgi:hypothetical protein